MRTIQTLARSTAVAGASLLLVVGAAFAHDSTLAGAPTGGTQTAVGVDADQGELDAPDAVGSEVDTEIDTEIDTEVDSDADDQIENQVGPTGVGDQAEANAETVAPAAVLKSAEVKPAKVKPVHAAKTRTVKSATVVKHDGANDGDQKDANDNEDANGTEAENHDGGDANDSGDANQGSGD